MPLTPGQILNNRYRIAKQIGQGGFGAVYRAWDLNLNLPCALKENFDASAEATRQFAREANMLAALHHPNLPRVGDHFSIPGQGQYLVMDFVEGRDLQEIMQTTDGPLPEVQVLAWFKQVCEALEYLHTRTPPIVHRDIKPANIRIKPDGTAMLVDFGIAKFYDPSLRTTMGARAVTPGFSPFEQYGQKPTDSRTDIYGLGATLYTLLTRSEPPEAIERMGGRELPPPRSLNSAISETTELVILKAMENLPDRRFQSVAELRQALFSEGAVPAAAQPGLVPAVGIASPVSPSGSQPTIYETSQAGIAQIGRASCRERV